MDKALKGEVSSAEAKTAISSLKIFTSDKILAIRDHRNRQERIVTAVQALGFGATV